MNTTVMRTGCAALLGLLMVGGGTALAQRAPAKLSAPPASARQGALADLTGYWASVVTEDWRWRMLTAARGDDASVPLNAAGKKLANEFNPAAYGGSWSQVIDCRAYGAAGLMRMPTRVHITWADDNTLQLQSDWGEQTRKFYFDKARLPQQGPTPQGVSFAIWQHPIIGARNGFAAPPKPLPGGKLYVVTDDLAPGWLRRNGIPYGAKTQMQEWYQTFHDPAGKLWFDVTTRVDDAEYLTAPFITSDDYRHEADGSMWAPHPCKQVAD